MQCPVTKQFWIAYEIDSLWHKFECIILENNHRQGEDKEYANMLNRIRVGQETSEDIAKLNERVRGENHRDIQKKQSPFFWTPCYLCVAQKGDIYNEAIHQTQAGIDVHTLHRADPG